jgi:hypothetical protein
MFEEPAVSIFGVEGPLLFQKMEAAGSSETLVQYLYTILHGVTSQKTVILKNKLLGVSEERRNIGDS